MTDHDSHRITIGGIGIQFRVATFGEDVEGRLRIVKALRALRTLVWADQEAEDAEVRKTAEMAEPAVELLLLVFVAIVEQVAKNRAAAARPAEATNG